MICVNSVNVSPDCVVLKVGEWYYGARASVCPTDATCKCVSWSSANTNIATVNPTNGYIRAKAAGDVRIYATACDGSNKKDYITVHVVNSIKVNSVTMNCTALSVKEDARVTLTATVAPANADNKTLTWQSSNTAVASVNNGIVTAVAKGTAVITASTNDGSNKSASCTVTVTGDTLVTSLTPSITELYLTEGNSCTLGVTVLPENATNKGVCWRSANTSIATINCASGLVYAKVPGTTWLHVTACDGSGKTASCKITVEPFVHVESITLNCTEKTIGKAETLYLHADVQPCCADNKTVIWSTNKSSVATVSDTGAVTGISKGTAVITARTADGGLTARCTVECDGKKIVTIKKASASIPDSNNRFDYFVVTFKGDPKDENNRYIEWHSIGLEMSEAPRSNGLMGDEEIIEYGYPWEVNDLHNSHTTYTIEQLAFLYWLDPLGLKYYIKQHSSGTLTEQLLFKDSVYTAIYPDKALNKFKINNNGDKIGIGAETDRTKYYTDAELLFGGHTILDLPTLIHDGIDLALDLIALFFPKTASLTDKLSTVNTLFFARSIGDAFYSVMSNQISNAVENGVANDAVSILFWPKKVFEVVENMTNMLENAFQSLTLNDTTIHTTIADKENYKVVIKNQGDDISLEEFLAAYQNANNS